MTRLAGLGANIVAAPYTSCMGTLEGSFELFEYDGGDPLYHLARAHNNTVCPHGMGLRLKAMSRAIGELGIDGVVFASNMSCKVFSVMQMDEQRHVSETLGVPAVMIDMDHADPRKYNEEGVFLRLQALLEAIDAKRA